jgi:tripartite-type tricarboxylate transporter receptor subunit TctC
MNFAPCRIFTACLAVAFAALASLGARAEDWRPDKITVYSGHAPSSSFGRAATALGAAWQKQLGVPVVIVPRGRASMLRAAGELMLKPRDGRFVVAGDLGALAIGYARTRPDWLWARSLEHIGVFAVDPIVLFTSTSSGLDDFGEVQAAARGRSYPVAVSAWDSIENIVLQDAARAAGLLFAVTPAGGGEGLFSVASRGTVRLGFGRMSLLRAHRRSLRILAQASVLDAATASHVVTMSALMGVPAAPAGGFAAITVHAGVRNGFPERHDRLRRTLDAARADKDYLEALEDLDLLPDESGHAHDQLMPIVRQWWDAAARVAPVLAGAPAELRTRGKLTVVEEEGRRLRYLGLDGKIHNLSADAELTEVTIAGAASTGDEPLAALRAGMLCEIAWPSSMAVQASRLACK